MKTVFAFRVLCEKLVVLKITFLIQSWGVSRARIAVEPIMAVLMIIVLCARSAFLNFESGRPFSTSRYHKDGGSELVTWHCLEHSPWRVMVDFPRSTVPEHSVCTSDYRTVRHKMCGRKNFLTLIYSFLLLYLT
jgi:hypothetical protein